MEGQHLMGIIFPWVSCELALSCSVSDHLIILRISDHVTMVCPCFSPRPVSSPHGELVHQLAVPEVTGHSHVHWVYKQNEGVFSATATNEARIILFPPHVHRTHLRTWLSWDLSGWVVRSFCIKNNGANLLNDHPFGHDRKYQWKRLQSFQWLARHVNWQHLPSPYQSPVKNLTLQEQPTSR